MAVSAKSPQRERPPFRLVANRLVVATQSEKDFLAAFEEQFWVLMNSERQNLVLDLTHTEGLDLTAYQMVALNLFEIGSRNKKLVIRIPEPLEKYFRQAGLYRKTEIEVVRILGKAPATPPAAVEESRHDSLPAANQAKVEKLMNDLDRLVTSDDQGGASQIAQQARASLRENISHVAASSEPGQASTRDADGGATGVEEVPIELIRRVGSGAFVDIRTNETIQLPPTTGGEFSIGRTPGNELQIASPLVSRKHATIRREGDRYFIRDLASGNGTYVNGARIEPETDKPLFHGYRVVLAVTRQYPNGAKAYVFQQAEI
ncbi:MAG: FHA domain-containing protein [Planctomycetota bacterium]